LLLKQKLAVITQNFVTVKATNFFRDVNVTKLMLLKVNCINVTKLMLPIWKMIKGYAVKRQREETFNKRNTKTMSALAGYQLTLN
jgi:hypothetical protein